LAWQLQHNDIIGNSYVGVLPASQHSPCRTWAVVSTLEQKL